MPFSTKCPFPTSTAFWRFTRTPLAAALATLTAGALPSGVRAEVVGRGEFLVGPSAVAPFQGRCSAAMDPQGGFVLSWDGNNNRVGVQSFAADGLRRGSELYVGASFASATHDSLAMDESGNFMVVWSERTISAPSESIRGQRFTPAPALLGDDFQINTVRKPVSSPVAAMSAAGAFVVAWDAPSSATVHFQRFSQVGVPAGVERVVSGDGSEHSPSTVMHGDGSFALAWFTHPLGIAAKRFGANGGAMGSPFRVDTTGGNYASSPDVAADASKNMVIVWRQPDDTGDGIFARRFDATGAPMGPDFPVSTTTALYQDSPVVAVAADGAFVIAWRSKPQLFGDSASRIEARLYDASGAPLSGEFPVNIAPGVAREPCLAATADGSFVIGFSIAPTSQAPPYVYARRFRGVAGTALALGPLVASDDPVANGAGLTYTTSVINNSVPGELGVGEAASITVNFALGSGATMDSGFGGGWICGSGARASCSFAPTLAAGDATSPLTIVVTAAPDGSSFPVTAVAAADQYEADNADNFRSVTTGLIDTRPNAFSFTDQTDVIPSSKRISNKITISGIAADAPISVTGGSYRINTGQYTSAAGTIRPGDTVNVRHTASYSPRTRVDTVLTIGGVSDSFSSTTNSSDMSPDPFEFQAQEGVPVSTMIESNIITPTGFNTTTPVRANLGAEFRIGGGNYTSADGVLYPGQTLQVRQMSASTPNMNRFGSVRVGDIGATFRTRTAP